MITFYEMKKIVKKKTKNAKVAIQSSHHFDYVLRERGRGGLGSNHRNFKTIKWY